MQRFPNAGFSCLGAPESLPTIPPADAPAKSTTWSKFDGAQLPRTMAFNQSEFNWYIVEGVGTGDDESERRIACMFTVHCTGPRVERVSLGLSLIDPSTFGNGLGGLIPSGLPLLAPFKLETDNRPLFMAVLYDLDHPEVGLQTLEVPLDAGSFDPATFSVCSEDGMLQLQQFDPSVLDAPLPTALSSFFEGSRYATAIKVKGPQFDVELFLRPRKPMLTFGHAGDPQLRHGSVVTHYAQRPRLDVIGRLSITSPNRRELVSKFQGDASQDRQWLTVSNPSLKWIWPHLRLSDGRELMGYVIRDSSAGRWASANDGRELGRAAWVIEVDGSIRRLNQFDVSALQESEVRSDRGLVPTRFAVKVPELGLNAVLEHMVPAPFVRLNAFGRLLDAGTWESPARILDANQPISGHCWVEVVNAAAARLARADG